MAKHIKALIRPRGGPIAVAEYMHEICRIQTRPYTLTPMYLEPMDGDFVPMPSISQMFGEMVGVWTMCLWHQMGQPEIVNLIELGPCRDNLIPSAELQNSKIFRKRCPFI